MGKQGRSHCEGAPQDSVGINRRPSVTYRAVKAVDDLARQLSMPDFSLEDVEDHLEKELKRDAVHPETTLALLRNSGAKILRSKRVLLMVVVLNVIDCVLVLGELLLDIHFIKDMVHKTKLLTIRFATILTESFAIYFGDLGHNDIDIFYNRILSVMYRSVHSNESIDVIPNATVPNYTLVDPFVKENVPRFLRNDIEAPVLEERLAYAFHKTSITVLGILTMMVLLKIFCYGTRFFRKKMELLDGIIVLSSFVVDLVFIQGMVAYPLEEAVQILAFLIPWRIVRVANSFLIAVLDRAHLKLKMEYKQKKKIQKKLEIAVEKNIYYKNVIYQLRDMYIEENIPQSKITECILSVDPPRFKTSTKFKKLKKNLQFQCIRRTTSGERSPPFDSKDTETFVMPIQARNSLVSGHTPLTSVLSNSTKRSSTSRCSDQGQQHPMLPQQSHSVHFHLGSEDSGNTSESDEFDDDFGIKLLGFSDGSENKD